MTVRYFPLDEYTERWRRVDQALRAHSLDVAVVWSRSAGTYDRCADLLYLANYYGNQPGQGRRGPQGFAAAILRREEPPELFADVQDPRADLIEGEVLATLGIEQNQAVGVALSKDSVGSRRADLECDHSVTYLARLSGQCWRAWTERTGSFRWPFPSNPNA